ncbi:DUF1294 domain-containing protein [Flavobacterium sp.]|uniref:DUF1294 domain-containing protein n=1 Tax=Flavobacterium sp. TaxID=239 RepID=UPI0037501F56
MSTFIIYLSIINILGFFLIWYDKKQAISNKYRISEKTLLLIGAIGGIIGSAFGMLFFTHKTSKTTYLSKFFGIIFVQILMLLYFFKL